MDSSPTLSENPHPCHTSTPTLDVVFNYANEYKNPFFMHTHNTQVQAIVDHHHPGHDGTRTTITKVRFVDPTSRTDANDKVLDESTEVRDFN
jgi:hypothetical protein